MNDLFQATWVAPVQSNAQAIKPALWKNPPGANNFAAVLKGEIKKEEPTESQDPKPSSDKRDREDKPADASSDQSTPLIPIGGTPTPPSQPVESPRTGSSKDQASQPASGGAADPAVANSTAGTAAAPVTGQAPVPPAAVLAAAAGQALAAQVAAAAQPAAASQKDAAAPQAGAAPNGVPDPAVADLLKAAKKGAAVTGASPDPASALPAPVSPAAAGRQPDAPQLAAVDLLQASVPAQAKAKETDPAGSAKLSTDTAAAQVQPAAVDPASVQGTQPTLAGVRLTSPSSTTFEPARLTEAQNQNLVSQVVNNVETLVKSRQTSLHLMLDPADLGRIDLHLTSSSAGMGVSLIAHQSGTSQLLESQVAQLRQALDQAGIHLTNLSVGQQNTPSSSGQNSQRQHNQSAHRQSAPADEPAVDPQMPVSGRVSSEGFDYRV